MSGPPVRPCVLDDVHPGHLRVNGKWCPGIEDEGWGPADDEEADREAGRTEDDHWRGVD